jgi:hypothetical protein
VEIHSSFFEKFKFPVSTKKKNQHANATVQHFMKNVLYISASRGSLGGVVAAAGTRLISASAATACAQGGCLRQQATTRCTLRLFKVNLHVLTLVIKLGSYRRLFLISTQEFPNGVKSCLSLTLL